jgi:hypothetical protein
MFWTKAIEEIKTFYAQYAFSISNKKDFYSLNSQQKNHCTDSDQILY